MDEDRLFASLRKFVWDDEKCGVITSFVSKESVNAYRTRQSGLLLQGVMGGGKTSVLRLLHDSLQSTGVQYIDCSTLSLTDRGEVERNLLPVVDGMQRTILLDNIDFFPSVTRDIKVGAPLTVSSRSFTSAALAAMDYAHTIVIATCTNIEAVESSFLHNYRFGQPIKLGIPSRVERVQIFREVLRDAGAQVDCDVPELSDRPHIDSSESHVNTEEVRMQKLSVQELALRTQGFTACDIFKLMRDQILYSSIHTSSSTSIISPASIDHTNASTTCTKLSLSALLQAISLTVPSAGLQAQNAEVTRFIRHIDTSTPRTALVGMETAQRHLLKCIYTVVPELRENSRDMSSVRKCSGIVLVGPSGSGKTALTEWMAQATHRHCKFIAVPCADLVHKVVGETERKLAEIFSTARELSPCIVLLDNLDMLLGASNSHHTESDIGNGASKYTGTATRRVRSQRTRHQAVDRMLSTLLVEIDGLDSASSSAGGAKQPSVIVVATTTRMDCLDRALVRPGRLEEHIVLTLPNVSQRRECILSLFDSEAQRLLALNDVREDNEGGVEGGDAGSIIRANMEQRNKDIDDIARCTEQRSYAYLRALYQEATIAYARDVVFSKLSLSSAQSGSGSNAQNSKAGQTTEKVHFATVLASAGGPVAKLEFVCQYMLKRVKLF